MSSKLAWLLVLLLSAPLKVMAEMKNAPGGAFMHAFLAEWTSYTSKLTKLQQAPETLENLLFLLNIVSVQTQRTPVKSRLHWRVNWWVEMLLNR